MTLVLSRDVASGTQQGWGAMCGVLLGVPVLIIGNHKQTCHATLVAEGNESQVLRQSDSMRVCTVTPWEPRTFKEVVRGELREGRRPAAAEAA